MEQLDKRWKNYQQVLRWLEAKYHKGEIDSNYYLDCIRHTTSAMQQMVIAQADAA